MLNSIQHLFVEQCIDSEMPLNVIPYNGTSGALRMLKTVQNATAPKALIRNE